MLKWITSFAMSLVLLSTLSTNAQSPDSTGPGTVFVIPEATDDPANDDLEISTDLGFFLDIGYENPDYNIYYNLRQDAARDVVIPDYTKRTGKIPPDDVLLEIAPVFITGGDYNDMLIVSHLPGDCNAGGCLIQIYRTKDGEKWDKVAEVTSLAFAFKPATDQDKGEFVAVGNDEYPSKLYKWNGLAFESQ